MQATNGSFSGTTISGGANENGAVFKITPGGTLTTLYSFCSQPNCTDGTQPTAGLVQATDGDLCGTTLEGCPTLVRLLIAIRAFYGLCLWIPHLFIYTRI